MSHTNGGTHFLGNEDLWEAPWNWEWCSQVETSLLRKLQAQTLPDANSGKIHPSSIIVVTFEPIMPFDSL